MSIIASASVPPANRIIDADTADLTAIPRQSTNEGRFPANQPYTGRAAVPTDDRYAEGYADGLQRALTAGRAAVSDAELIDLAARRNPVGVHLLAEAIRNGCPPWCTNDHTGDVLEVDGFTIGQVHERIVAELPAADPAWVDRPATAVVLVESTSEAGAAITPARVILAVAEGAEGAHPGEQDCQGWTGTPAQARALAAALVAGAELVDA